MNLISKRKMKWHILSSQSHLALKIIFILLFCCLTSAFSMPSYSQSTHLNLNLKNSSVEEVLNKIEEQTEFRFIYNKKFIDVNRKVAIASTNENVFAVLDKLFQNEDVAYEVFDRQIVLSQKNKAKDFQLTETTQSTNPVGGKITDAAGEPLIGVSVSVKGTIKGTMTDTNGIFKIDATEGETLVVTYIGFLPQELKVGGRKEFNIVLKEDVKVLGDVVIVGFGTQKKESITGAISAISGDQLVTTNAATTSTALAGRISGINSRQPDGRPGSGTTIRIRGMGTPLYVIDGVQKDEGQFNNIDPNDIESISILKDASAAIYGVRAANGVVVVKTKSGIRETKNTVNLTATYGWQNFFRFPKPANTQTYVETKYQSDIIKKATDPNYNMKYSAEDLAKWQQGTEKDYRGFDWYDYVINTSPMSYIGGNVSGGSEDINYYLSLSHLNQDAIIVNYGGFNRTNIQMSVDANINKRLKIGGNMNGRIETRKNPGVPGQDDYWQALFAIYRNLPTRRPFANDNPNYPALTSSENNTNFGMLNYERSGTLEETWRVIQLNISAEYKIIDGLKLSLLGGYYYADKFQRNHEYTYKLYEYVEESDTYKVISSMDNPYMERTYEKVEETSGQFILDYDKKIDVHSLSFTVGGEAIRRKSPRFWLQDRPAANAIDQVYLTSMVGIQDRLNEPQSRAGFISRINYNYDNRYLLEFIGRYDGAWKFPKKDRWGFFPSVSAGWRISEESFWKGIKNTVSDLKLRASYGVVGLDETPDYSAFDYLDGYDYNQGGAVVDGEWVTGTKPRGVPVRTLSWLEAKMFNVGFDFGFFDNKLTGDFNFFTRKLDGIPERKNDVLIPSESGFELPRENLKSEMLRGFDGSITWRDKVKDLNYSLGGNFTFSRKYDWHQYKPRHGNSWQVYRNSIDERYSNINWGKQVIGQFQSWEQIANHPVNVDGKGNTTIRPGDLIYKDVNGDGIVNGMDDRPIGYREGDVPYLNFNFVFDFEYKGFDLGLMFAGSTFSSFYMESEMKTPLHDGGNNPQYYLSDQWHLSDIHDANSALVAGRYPTIIEGNGNHSNYWKNDFWLKNISYLKLKNLEFGYTLPSHISGRLGMTKARFFTSMQNLFSIDNLGDIDMDPEIDKGSGIQYPTNRIISIGCNLTF
ncbi:TonB-dependent receptor [Dysgonomonas sp. ZJ279]|uniref:TonB-dependent receptor n=1 Tax=Dysgonomonas sp. ZJ279 TaxID=2709796 RepID=UPI002107228E|nr:TonB-dependent receptor [Dysgonomonas sp. ZJ279]